VVETLGEALAGSSRPLLLAAGVAGFSLGRPVTEEDASPFTTPDAPRGASENLALSFVDQGVRVISVRFAPSVHGEGDHGFVATLTGVARDRGVASFVGDGSNRWSAVHRSDASRVVALGIESAPAGSILHAVGEEGIPTRDIAESIGRGMGLPVTSVQPENAAEHFGWIGMFFGMDASASSARTQQLLGWTPTGPTLLEDLAEGSYFSAI
jgi:nucleoside-diphosphate-sugar epimerase